MSNNIDNKNFNEIVKNGQIRIPKIQRDYAQGRKQKDVNEIRASFVRSLLLVVMGKRDKALLDFVYGSERNNAFEPLDGQQRLTTIFLLHWVLGVKLEKDGESVLTYETRNTSAAFCKELIKHEAFLFIEEARQKTEQSKRIAEEEKTKSEKKQDKSLLKAHVYSPAEIIQARDWFQWAWKFDPTINSMLVMIDTISAQIDWSLDLDTCRKRLNNITFNHLDLGELGMSDELFIKMNARGKLLSDFDKLKSTLEEEIQLQQKELTTDGSKPLADSSIEEDWRKYMDGKWIDLFWQKFGSPIIKDPINADNDKVQLDAAKASEYRMKIFLLRMMAIQLFTKHPENEELYEATYQLKAISLDNLFLAYQNQLINWRSEEKKEIPDNLITIDFRELIDDINIWLVPNGSGLYKDITSLLPQETNFESKSDDTYFDRFTADVIGNDAMAVIFAMIQFIKKFSYDKDSKAWLKNFCDWMRITRNIFTNDNNTDRIDKRKLEANAFDGVLNIVADLVKFVDNTDAIFSDDCAVLKFISQVETYQGVDNQSLEEEKIKVKLRLKEEIITDSNGIIISWNTAIDKAERNLYLWGQVRCLLYWSFIENSYNLKLFNSYSDNLNSWIDLDKKWSDQELFYRAMLCINPTCWEENNRLYEFNHDRDNSIKRCLRDKPDYGKHIKQFVDTWLNWNRKATFKDFCNYIIETTKSVGWVKFYKQYPRLIWESWRKRFFIDRGHVIFAQQKTQDSHCFDPILLYLRELFTELFCINKVWVPNVEMKFCDSKSDEGHAIFLTIGERFINVKWGENSGEYIIETDGTPHSSTDVEDVAISVSNMIYECKANLDIATKAQN